MGQPEWDTTLQTWLIIGFTDHQMCTDRLLIQSESKAQQYHLIRGNLATVRVARALADQVLTWGIPSNSTGVHPK